MTLAAGAVLAGGASSRMGADKALVRYDGLPMAQRVVAALRSGGCEPVWLQGGEPGRLAELAVEVRPDGRGPDGGRVGPVRAIADALGSSPAPTLVVAACDLPSITGDLVRTLVETSRRHDAVAVAVAAGRRHLVAAWPVGRREGLLAAIDRGVRSYGDVLADLGAVDVEVDPALVHNVNRPDDLPGHAPGRGYPRETMTVEEITVDELADRLAEGAHLVDVREPIEFEEARVPGGLLVPLGEVPERVDDFRSAGTTYVICRSGARSMRACEYLAGLGLDVANVAGGTLAWIASGRDVAAGPA